MVLVALLLYRCGNEIKQPHTKKHALCLHKARTQFLCPSYVLQDGWSLMSGSLTWQTWQHEKASEKNGLKRG